MDSKSRQTQAYKCMLDLTSIPLGERRQIMRGAEVFFERGWPNGHFTIDMATRAGRGLFPPAYDGLGSEGRYFFTLKAPARATPDECANRRKTVSPVRLPCLSAKA
jgi:hypothetical protein